MRISDWSSDVCSSDLRDDHPNIQVGPLRPVAQQDRIPILRRTSPMSATDENRIEIWKTIIDVQKHFNELEMRIRNVAVTVLAAFLAAAGFTMKERSEEHTSELQSLMRISYAVFCLKTTKKHTTRSTIK